MLGFPWISEEHVARKRGYVAPPIRRFSLIIAFPGICRTLTGPQKPGTSSCPTGAPGSISCGSRIGMWNAELAKVSPKSQHRFNPIFVLPVADETEPPASSTSDGETISYRPGRKTGTGSAAISTPTRTISPRQPIRGFRRVSLLSMVKATGETQPSSSGPFTSLEDIRRSAERPVVVFPECTTSNGRGLLRFARVFEGYNVPVKECDIFIMCIR